MIASRRSLRLAGSVLVLAATASLAGAGADDLSRGAAQLAPFKRELQAALQAGLAQGPVEAIAACRVKAPEIAQSLSHEGVRVGRASHRLRNPANVAPDWAAPILAAYVADASDRTPRAVPLGDGRVGYVEPILVQPPCLVCHGESLAPPVAARIAELYPADRATGFRVGDLRGVFWVELPPGP